MFVFSINKNFDRESGCVKSKIKLIQSDPGLPVKIIDVDGQKSDEITLWANDWNSLETAEANTLFEIKKTIDRIRENSVKVVLMRTFEY